MSDTVFVDFSKTRIPLDRDFLRLLVNSVFPDIRTFRLDHVEGVKSVDEVVEILQKDNAAYFLIGNPPYSLGFHTHSVNGTSEFSLSVGAYAVDNRNKHSERNIKDLIERCRKVYMCIHPAYGRGDFGLIFDSYGTDLNARGAYKRQVFWLNFYGPEIVDQIGRDTLRSVSYGRVEYFADRGALLVRGNTPSEDHKYSDVIREHLFGKRSLIDRLLGR